MTFPVSLPYAITTKFNLGTHPGIDIAPIPAGTEGVQCHAPENCLVVKTGFVASLEGNYVILRGDSGMFYYFGHFAKTLVTLNQRVDEGGVIGILGQTGQATGIHTHHEVRRVQGGNQIDPEVYYKEEHMNPIDVLRMIAGEVQGFDAEVYNGKYDAQLLAEWGSKPLEQVVREAFQRSTKHRYELDAQITELQKQVDAGGASFEPVTVYRKV